MFEEVEFVQTEERAEEVIHEWQSHRKIRFFPSGDAWPMYSRAVFINQL
jgi:hypothetical protein